MRKPLCLALLVAGLVLVAYGLAASDSAGSGISRLLTGAPTGRTIGLLVGGVALAVAGGAGLSGGGKTD